MSGPSGTRTPTAQSTPGRPACIRLALLGAVAGPPLSRVGWQGLCALHPCSS